MINPMQVAKKPRCPATASLAALVILAALFVTLVSSLPAQTARPLLGTLHAQLPRGLLPSEDYWLYVNGQIVSAPPHGPFTTLTNEFSHVAVNQDTHEYWDAEGLAVRSKGNHLTFYRSGVRERTFESQTIQLARGNYVVEFVTRAADRRSFPFAVARVEVQVEVGQTEEVEFGLPAGAVEVVPIPLRPMHPGLTPEGEIKNIQSDFASVVQKYEADPIVPVLNQLLLNLSVTPPGEPSVFADLPDSMGGGRAVDARQVSLIIDDLEANYAFQTIDENSSLRRAAPPVPQFAAHIAMQINEHNKRISRFRQIVKALEQAKRQ